jgi:hypothetical protein
MGNIKILNPLPLGSLYVGKQRAERMVKTGRAEWLSERTIRYNESHPHYQTAVMNSLEATRGYDARGSMTLKEIANIPVINPNKLRR